MRLLSFLIPLLCFQLRLVSQTDTTQWKLLERQQQKATVKIHRTIKHDTLISTSAARIHIYYNNDPDKPYLLLLHGMGMNGKTNWMNQVPVLSRKFNLIVPDLIYFGESTSGSQNMSPDFQASQIHEAVTALGVSSKINIMGFSYGGLVAALYNELYQTAIDKLVIIDAPLKFYSVAMSDSMAKVSHVKSITRLIVPESTADFKAMQKAVISRYIPVPEKLKRKILYHVFFKTKELRLQQMNYLLSHETYYRQLNYKLDKTSTLFIWGEKDGIIPAIVGRKLHEAFPNSTLLLIKKAKHDAPFNHSKKVNHAVIDFLTKT